MMIDGAQAYERILYLYNNWFQLLPRHRKGLSGLGFGHAKYVVCSASLDKLCTLYLCLPSFRPP